MFNFATIGAYKQVRNNPRTKVEADTKNGQVLVLDEVNGTANFPADATAAQGKNLYVAFNIIDTPELWITNDFVIKEGEFVRAFLLADLADLPVTLSHDIITDNYADLAKGDVLVPEAATGNWVKGVATDFAISLEIIKKNGFGNQGIDAIVRVK